MTSKDKSKKASPTVKSKVKPNHSSKSRPRLTGFVLLFYCLAFALIAFCLYYALLHQKTETGQFDGGTYRGENLSHSLDLRLASKAVYASAPLTDVKDLPKDQGLFQQIVSFPVTTDKLTEYALAMLPNTPKPANGYPVVIICHGYVNPAKYETTTDYIADMEFYASHGFVVVKPDFRGQGLSSAQGIPEGAYYSMAYNTDVMSLITSLKETSYIDKSNINLWGHSMGAYVALRASVLSHDIKNTILLSGPVGSLNQMYLAYVPPSDENNPDALKIRNADFSKYGTPGENSSFWKNASPTSFLGQSRSNYQIYVGLQDRVVPPELSGFLDADLTAIHKPHLYQVYPDGVHNLNQQRPQIWSQSLALFKKT